MSTDNKNLEEFLVIKTNLFRVRPVQIQTRFSNTFSVVVAVVVVF